jgi:predicted lipoprotein with Yx(FWY)xxD motif
LRTEARRNQRTKLKAGLAGWESRRVIREQEQRMTTMFKTRRTALLSLVSLAVVAVGVAGCGSSSSGTTSSSAAKPSSTTSSSSGAAGAYGAAPAPAASTTASGGTAVDVATSKLGKILVDSKGRTLYLFVADTGSSSTCNGACAGVWPPLTTTKKPVAGSGVTASLLGTTKRSDGTLEVTYDGHPLYYYAGDSSAGQTTGQALNQFGAPWYVVAPSGAAIK